MFLMYCVWLIKDPLAWLSKELLCMAVVNFFVWLSKESHFRIATPLLAGLFWNWFSLYSRSASCSVSVVFTLSISVRLGCSMRMNLSDGFAEVNYSTVFIFVCLSFFLILCCTLHQRIFYWGGRKALFFLQGAFETVLPQLKDASAAADCVQVWWPNCSFVACADFSDFRAVQRWFSHAFAQS